VIDVTDGADIDVLFLEHDYFSASFLVGFEDYPRAPGTLARCTRNKRKNPLRPEPEGVYAAAFSATYLRDDSGSSPHEPDDDADGNDLDRAMETDTTKRTVVTG
jgi:hypothetical protein